MRANSHVQRKVAPLAYRKWCLATSVMLTISQQGFVQTHHHHIRFCGCPGLRDRQHLATPHTRSP